MHIILSFCLFFFKFQVTQIEANVQNDRKTIEKSTPIDPSRFEWKKKQSEKMTHQQPVEMNLIYWIQSDLVLNLATINSKTVSILFYFNIKYYLANFEQDKTQELLCLHSNVINIFFTWRRFVRFQIDNKHESITSQKSFLCSTQTFRFFIPRKLLITALTYSMCFVGGNKRTTNELNTC